MKTETRKLIEIEFRENLYPRFEHKQFVIQKYANSIEFLPPIKINQDNILIDGFHRLKAHQLAEESEIRVEIVQTKSEKKLKNLAYQWNSNHGLQLSNAEKRKYAVEMIEEISVIELMQTLSVSERTIQEWTQGRRQELKKQRDRRIIELYLRAWNTQEMVAEIVRREMPFFEELTQKTVSRVIDSSQNRKSAEMTKLFDYSEKDKPHLYNIWNLKKQDRETDQFGAFPQIYLENLLYYHTELLDIIYDPFAGEGVTIDVCKKMFRRYYCSDQIVQPGREKDILEWAIQKGLPDDLPKPNLVFLDPPYWKQAENQYSDSPDDLGNMDLSVFNSTMKDFLCTLKKWKITRIAIVIQATQWKNDFEWTDHIFDFHEMLFDQYKIEGHIILPYQTQQYAPDILEKAKQLKKCLCLHRDLVVWKRIK